MPLWWWLPRYPYESGRDGATRNCSSERLRSLRAVGDTVRLEGSVTYVPKRNEAALRAAVAKQPVVAYFEVKVCVRHRVGLPPWAAVQLALQSSVRAQLAACAPKSRDRARSTRIEAASTCPRQPTVCPTRRPSTTPWCGLQAPRSKLPRSAAVRTLP